MEAKYPQGFKIWEPRESAPPWIKGRISVHLETFQEWAKQFVDEKGYVSLDLKVKDGSEALYAQVNTWKPNGQKQEKVEPTIEYPKDEIDPNDLPF